MQFQLVKPEQGLQMWARLKPGLDDELNRFWWQEIKVTDWSNCIFLSYEVGSGGKKDKDADALPV